MGFFIVFLLFAAFITLNLFISFFAPHFIPYLGFFPYKEILPNYHLPEFITKFANFDGVHYILIAQQGYMQNEQAFFPLYPLLIKYLTPLFFGNSLFTGLFISNLSFLVGLFFFSKYLKQQFGNSTIQAIIIFLLLFPTSFFFGALYTEGLFFLLFFASLYFLKKENYLPAGIFAFFTALTRLVGVFIIIPFLFHFLSQKLKIKNQNYKSKFKYLLVIFSPLLGLLTYMFYLWKTTGNPLYFYSSQPLFGANRSTHLIFLPQVYFRYFKIFITADWNHRYLVAFLELLLFTFTFIVLILDFIKNLKLFRNWKLEIRNSDRLGLNLFSFANLLLPTLTGTFSSIPRYALLSLSAFVFLGQLKQTWIKILLIIVFLILHVVTLGLFTQGYFIG